MLEAIILKNSTVSKYAGMDGGGFEPNKFVSRC
jgi:hypothetical protein